MVPQAVTDFIANTQRIREIGARIRLITNGLNEVQNLRTEEFRCKHRLTILRPQVSDFLQTIPEMTFAIPSDGGKIKFIIRKRKRYDLKSVTDVLHAFFQKSLGGMPDHELEALAQGAALDLEKNLFKAGVPVPVRTFGKK